MANAGWLTPTASELELSSAPIGFAVKLPLLDLHRSLCEGVRSERGDLVEGEVEPGCVMLRIPQQNHDWVMIDIVDRVDVGAAFLKQLVAAGL